MLVALMHLALLWALSRYLPVERMVRYVVYQYAQPLSPMQDAASTSRAISPQGVSLRAAPELPLFSQAPPSTVPLQTTRTLPEPRQNRRKDADAPAAQTEPQPVPLPEDRVTATA